MFYNIKARLEFFIFSPDLNQDIMPYFFIHLLFFSLVIQLINLIIIFYIWCYVWIITIYIPSNESTWFSYNIIEITDFRDISLLWRIIMINKSINLHYIFYLFIIYHYSCKINFKQIYSFLWLYKPLFVIRMIESNFILIQDINFV